MSAPRMAYKDYLRHCEKMHRVQMPCAAKDHASVKKWSETEKRYFYGVLHGVGAYEGETLRITPNECEKHEYTPDFVTEVTEVYAVGGYEHEHTAMVYHEVKGNHRLGSQDGARLRWCFAAVSHPADIFVWAKESKRKGLWDIEVWYDGGRTRTKGRAVAGFKFNGRGGVEWLKRA